MIVQLPLNPGPSCIDSDGVLRPAHQKTASRFEGRFLLVSSPCAAEQPDLHRARQSRLGARKTATGSCDDVSGTADVTEALPAVIQRNVYRVTGAVRW